MNINDAERLEVFPVWRIQIYNCFFYRNELIKYQFLSYIGEIDVVVKRCKKTVQH